jgi:hypothetical protein
MADQPLSEREREILSFLLSAPAIPDGDVLRRQAAVAISSGRECPCGCASIGLKVDPAAAPQARLDLPTNLVEASTDDIAGVHQREPLLFLGEDLHFDAAVQPTDEDLQGAIGLILWVDGGWLSGIEIWGAGDFANPRTLPPAELFEAPQVASTP